MRHRDETPAADRVARLRAARPLHRRHAAARRSHARHPQELSGWRPTRARRRGAPTFRRPARVSASIFSPTGASSGASPMRSQLTGDETVVEIGPGRGALTDILAERAGRLIAIEYDRALAAMLRERYARRANVLDRRSGRARRSSLGELAGGPYVLVGNVPYYITTPILFHALAPPRAERAVYLVQREVAQRLDARAREQGVRRAVGERQAVARAETLFGVPRRARSRRRPRWRARSCASRRSPIRSSRRSEERRFRVLVQGAFGMRRKQMRRVVRSLFALDAEQADVLLAAAGIEPTRPAGGAERRAVRRAAARCAERAEPDLVAVREREGEPLELHRHVHRLHGDVGRRVKLDRREVEHRLDPGAHDPVERPPAPPRPERRSRRSPGCSRCDVRLEPARCRGSRSLRACVRSSRGSMSYTARMLKPRCRNPRYWASAAPIFPAPTITTRHSRPRPRISRSAVDELGDGVAEPALAERPEEGEVLPHLGRRRPAAPRQLFAGNGRGSPILEFLEEAEVDREAADGGFCDAFHDSGRPCEFIHKLAASANPHQTPTCPQPACLDRR